MNKKERIEILEREVLGLKNGVPSAMNVIFYPKDDEGMYRHSNISVNEAIECILNHLGVSMHKIDVKEVYLQKKSKKK